MPLNNRNLDAGTVLRARHKGQEHTCEVVETDDGLRYRLDDGHEFTSPSSAGKAAMGGVSCNGWHFWSLAGEGKPTVRAAPKKPVRAKAEKEGKAKAKKPATEHKAAVEHATTHSA